MFFLSMHKVCVHFDNLYFNRNGSETNKTLNAKFWTPPFFLFWTPYFSLFGLDCTFWLDSTLKSYYGKNIPCHVVAINYSKTHKSRLL